VLVRFVRQNAPIAVVVACTFAAGTARAATIPSAFFISKSENKNQVHYSVDVDEHCRPQGSAPVRAYWRDFEKGPNVTSPLLAHEGPAYGLKFQKVIKLEEKRGIVELAVRGLPSRILHVETREKDGKCVAETRAVVRDETVTLLEVFLKLKLLGVEYARFIGKSLTKGVVTEDVKN
jgi:hypothetical protein